MGVDLGELIQPEKISVEALTGKKLAVDAFNTIFQFLSIIRQPDGTPLMDSKGRVTSHLSGIFYRNLNLLGKGIKPAYVFDGKPPQLKAETVQKRSAARDKAREEWEKAKKAGDLERARSQAQRAAKLDEEMIEETKKLLSAMGIPFVQAPSEGEAQAAFMCQKGDVYATCSQDFDSILFGTPILVRNINVTGKRKLPNRNEYIDITPERFELSKLLESLGITQDQLIAIGVLIGTDFNPGIKGVGPKTALKKVKEKSLKELAEEYDFQVDPFQVAKIFTKPDVEANYSLEWSEINHEKVIEILHEEHEFSKERIENAIKKYEESTSKDQKSLEDFF